MRTSLPSVLDVVNKPHIYKSINGQWIVKHRRRTSYCTTWLQCGSFPDALINAMSIYEEHYA